MANAILFGKYHLIDRISAGGMAEVFRAKSYGVAGFEKILVIKKILPHLSKDKEFIDMFLDEAKISVSLSHANIVQVIDLGKEGDSYFMALEYVHGQDLSRTIVQGRKSEPLSIALSVYIVCEVLKALDYAHRRKDRNYRDLNIVHCDVSPQNILLSYEGEVKLTDFGISKAAFQSASSQGVVRGKYAYMSPEQVEGKGLDRRSDVFSVGIILFELLTGKRLFKRDSVDKTLRAVVSSPTPSVRDFNRDVDEDLDRIVARSLAKDRDKRSTDAAELLEDLSAWMFSRGIQVTSTDLSNYLQRIFGVTQLGVEASLEIARSSFTPLKDAPGESTPRPRAPRVFIPAGASSSMPTWVNRQTPGQPVILRRTNVVVLAVEWFLAAGGQSGAELDRRHRALQDRFQKRIRALHGETWEVFHNGMVGVWRLQEDPVGTAEQALECALALKNDEFPGAVSDHKGMAGLVQVLHAGSVLLEKESGLPLTGWQLSRTFFIPRYMVNRRAPGPVVVVTRPMRELTAGRFEFSELQPGGEGGLLPARSEVLGRLDPDGPGPRVAFSSVTRYVGQEMRLEGLERQLQEAIQGQPSVALFLGEEGSGRGRLLEWLHQNAARMGAASYLALAGPDGRDTAYSVVQELLRRVVGMEPSEAVASERQKLSRLAQLGLGQEEIALLASLFDEEREDEEGRGRRRERIQATVEKVVAGLCKDQPLLLIVDDLPWLDPLSQGVLRHLVANLGRRRLLVALAGPPGLEVPWLGAANVKTWRCEGLPIGDVQVLVCDMLGVSAVSSPLLQEIHRRSAGNPFWVKEIVGELADGGHLRIVQRRAELVGGSWPLAPVSRLSLERRLAGLSDAERLILVRLVVLGHQFPLEGAELALGGTNARERLRPLVQRGALRERQIDRTFYYRFRHSSLPETVLGSVPAPARQEAARSVAAALAGRPTYGRGRRTEMLARCMEQEGGPEASRALESAGDRLLYEKGYAAALRWYSAALGVERNPSRVRAIRRRMAHVHSEQGNQGEAESILRQCLDLARRAGPVAEVAELLLALGQVVESRGNLRSAVDIYRDGLAAAEEARSLREKAELHRHLGECLRRLGQMDESQLHIKTGFSLAQDLKDRALVIRHASSVGESYLIIGDYKRAQNNYLRCFAAAREMKSRALIEEAITGIALTYQYVGQPEQALKAWKEALGLAQEMDDPVEQAYIMSRMGAVYVETQRMDKAQHSLRLAMERGQKAGQVEMVIYCRVFLGYTMVCRGEVSSGMREVQEALRQAEDSGIQILAALAHLYLGHCHKQVGDERAATTSWRAAREQARGLRHARLLRDTALALGLDPGPIPTLDATLPEHSN